MTTVNPSQTGLDGAGAPTSKKGLKKQQKEAEKAKRKAEVAAKLEAEAADRQADDVSKDLYGIAPLIQSQLRTGRVWRRVGELTSDLVGQTVLVRARVHAKRGTGIIIQWNSSNPDTNGTEGRVQISEVSLFLGLLHARTVLGKEKVSLLERCPHFRSVIGEKCIILPSSPPRKTRVPGTETAVPHRTDSCLRV
jgi:hypothetical protein